MGETVEERLTGALRAERLGPFVEGKIRGDEERYAPNTVPALPWRTAQPATAGWPRLLHSGALLSQSQLRAAGAIRLAAACMQGEDWHDRRSTSGDRRKERHLVTGVDRCPQMRVLEVHGHEHVVGDLLSPGCDAPRVRSGFCPGRVSLSTSRQPIDTRRLAKNLTLIVICDPPSNGSGLVSSPSGTEPAIRR